MQALYNELAEYFDLIAAAGSVDTKKEVAFLKSIFDRYGIHAVLDVACGTGRHSIALAKKDFEVVGIDYAEKLLGVARAKTNSSNPRFILQNVADIRLDEKFDAAICMWSTFGELPYRKMLDGVKVALKPKGLFVIDSTLYDILPTGTVHKTYEKVVDGKAVKTEIDDIYEGKTRTREILNHIGDKTVKDHSEMDILTEADYIELLDKYGFRHLESYYDYVSVKTEDTKRLQLVFGL